MKALTFAVLLIIEFGCFAQSNDSPKGKLSTLNEAVLRDTIYLDTLIIDNELKYFTSKKWIVKSRTEEILFFQTIYNKTKDDLELFATGNFAPEFSKEVKSLDYARISYRLDLKGRSSGMMAKGGSFTYRPKHADSDRSKTIPILLKGLKESKKTICLDTLFIRGTNSITYVDIECGKEEDIMLQFMVYNTTEDTISIAISSENGGLNILEYSKILTPNGSESIYAVLYTTFLKDMFSIPINVECYLASNKRTITRVVRGQIIN
jgi:hypothetical protein